MYSWGDDTSTWKKGGYKYDGARRSYLDKLSKDSAKKGKRTYERRSEPDFKLVGTKDKGLLFKPDPSVGIECHVDADFYGNWSKEESENPASFLLNTGYVISYGRCPLV